MIARLNAWLAVFERRRVFLLTFIILLLAGLGLRLAWAERGDHYRPIASEMYAVAKSYAQTGTLADAYRPGSGPTAHLLPAQPVLVGTLYRLYGPGDPRSERLLSLVALGCIGLTLIGLNGTMALLGTPAWARLAAVAVICLVPLNFGLEMVVFRVWEQALAAAMMALYLWLLLRLDRRPAPLPWTTILLLAALATPIALVSPPAALGAYGGLAVLALRRRGVVAVGVAATLSAVLLIAASAPWALRNERVFGEKIWSRSNFGFNFALGFYPEAVNPADPRQAFVDRMAAIDPFEREPGYRAMIAAGGETGYNRKMSAETWAWVDAHPGDAAALAARHVAEFYLPPQWQWRVYTGESSAVGAKQAIQWAAALLAFAAIGWGLLRRDGRYLYPLAMLVLPVVPYVLVQPVLRYRYIILGLTIFLAADLVGRLLAPRRA